MQIHVCQNLTNNKKRFNAVNLCKNDAQTRNFKQKNSMMRISTTLSGVISHVRLFFIGQLRNPWQMLGFRGLKITAPQYYRCPRLQTTVLAYPVVEAETLA